MHDDKNVIKVDFKRKVSLQQTPYVETSHTEPRRDKLSAPIDRESTDRLTRIRSSLERINRLMSELRKLSESTPSESTSKKSASRKSDDFLGSSRNK